MNIMEIKSIDDIDIDALLDDLRSKTTENTVTGDFYDESGELVFSETYGGEWKLNSGETIELEIDGDLDEDYEVDILKITSPDGRYAFYYNRYHNMLGKWTEYDENGELKYKKGIDSFGNTREEYELEPNNKRKYHIKSYFNGELRMEHIKEYEDEDHERLLSDIKIKDGEIVSELEQKYNDEGRIIYSKDSSRGIIEIEKFHEYDDEGNRILFKDFRNNGKLSFLEKTTKDANGFVIYTYSSDRETWTYLDKERSMYYKIAKIDKLGDFHHFKDIVSKYKMEVIFDRGDIKPINLPT